MEQNQTLNLNTYKYLYRTGSWDIREFIDLVKIGCLTEQDFKEITDYDYQGYRAINEGKWE